MNEHLSERFSRRGAAYDSGEDGGEQAEVVIEPSRLNLRIREYVEDLTTASDGWTGKSQWPTAEEVLDIEDSDQTGPITIPTNRPKGAWDSIEQYLRTQYELTREDGIRALREAVTSIRCDPEASEERFAGQIGLYNKVHICGITPDNRGLGVRVTFSLSKVGKQIRWEQSSRLTTGSVVVLLPVKDNKQAIVATIAARPLVKLQQNPPEIDLFFTRTDDLELDPAIAFVMVEARGSIWESCRHVLQALQRLVHEPFPMSGYLVDAEMTVLPPSYLIQDPHLNLQSISSDNSLRSINVLEAPDCNPGTLDTFQHAAFMRMITKQLALIQGPPGTGKTHTSVLTIRVMLANRKPGDPPIIIACQTNHAIDQMLRYIATFEENFVRLGGRSKDQDIVKSRTLFEVRKISDERPPRGCYLQTESRKLGGLARDIRTLLSPLQSNEKPLDLDVLRKLNILSEVQIKSLNHGASKWLQDRTAYPEGEYSPWKVWPGDTLIKVPTKQQADAFAFEFEDPDPEAEELEETGAEHAAQEEDFVDELRGQTIDVADNFTCRVVPGTERQIKKFLEEQDLWKIPDAYRGALYMYLQHQMKVFLRTAFKRLAQEHEEAVSKRRIGAWEADEVILKEQAIIGMTMTGLSKHRALLTALGCKIIMIEEAAELQEAPVTAACIPTLEHLILVGDHRQLRPHVNIRELADEPYYLNVSLFERLINNGIEYNSLQVQRRMRPEFRQLLTPIYGDLIADHTSVTDRENRPDVPGMGGTNLFFFTHDWPEHRDDLMSVYNDKEASMIAGFFEYLVFNGVNVSDVTVLTFYNGQRKRIISELRKKRIVNTRALNVFTVDSYQGEENKIVILSLARSNSRNEIGFLRSANRACVALSRARQGFYLFGNGPCLHGSRELANTRRSLKIPPYTIWRKVINIFFERTSAGIASQYGNNSMLVPESRPVRVGAEMKIVCSNHGHETLIKEHDDWSNLAGGCEQNCTALLPCQHPCPLLCHPFGHDEVVCTACKEEATNEEEVDRKASPRRVSSAKASLTNVPVVTDAQRAAILSAWHNVKPPSTSANSKVTAIHAEVVETVVAQAQQENVQLIDVESVAVMNSTLSNVQARMNLLELDYQDERQLSSLSMAVLPTTSLLD